VCVYVRVGEQILSAILYIMSSSQPVQVTNRRHLITVFISSIIGLALAFYSIHVENQLRMHPGYEASCDMELPFFGVVSCTRVFSSPHANILSFWGIVEKNSYFDWSLPWLAIIYFILTLHYPLLHRRFLKCYFALAVMAVTFNIYLALILKFVLQEFCVICVSNYVVNGVIFYCMLSDVYRHRKVKKS